MADSGANLSPKQARLIAGLLTGARIGDAAAAANVSKRTAHRWMRDPVFVAELAAARRQMIGSSLDILTAGARRAAGVIVTILDDPSMPASVRLRAAAEVLDRLVAWVEMEDLQARIAALENRNVQP